MKTLIQRIITIFKYVLFFFRAILSLKIRRIKDSEERNSNEEE